MTMTQYNIGGVARQVVPVIVCYALISIVLSDSVRVRGEDVFYELPIMYEYNTSIGKLVRRSEAVVVAQFLRQSDEGESEWPFGKFRLIQPIHGDIGEAGDVLLVELFGTELHPDEGAQGMLFITRHWLWPSQIGFDQWKTSAEIDGQPISHWRLVGGVRGFISGDAQRLDHVENILRQYIAFLRAPKSVDYRAYGEFLVGLREDRDERVRKDQVYDEMHYFGNLTREQGDALLADQTVPEYLRDRLERRRARVQASIRLRDREQVEQEFREFNWTQKMQSGEPTQMREAIFFISSISSHELLKYQDIWVPHLQQVLRGDNPELAWSAANRLMVVKDMDSILLMIRRLRDPAVQYPEAIIASLKRATGQDFPFDPDAPEGVREAQIRVWEEWWEEQNR